jgi:hypothetical protein
LYVAIFSFAFLVEGWNSGAAKFVGPIDHIIKWRINLNHWWDDWPGGRQKYSNSVCPSIPLQISHGRTKERIAVSAVSSREPHPRATVWPFVIHHHLFVPCCHHHMTRPEGADRDDLQSWRVAANVLDKQ